MRIIPVVSKRSQRDCLRGSAWYAWNSKATHYLKHVPTFLSSKKTLILRGAWIFIEDLTVLKFLIKCLHWLYASWLIQCTLKKHHHSQLHIPRTLQCDHENREHLKYLRNVYCVMTNHSKDQDMRTSCKTTN